MGQAADIDRRNTLLAAWVEGFLSDEQIHHWADRTLMAMDDATGIPPWLLDLVQRGPAGCLELPGFGWPEPLCLSGSTSSRHAKNLAPGTEGVVAHEWRISTRWARMPSGPGLAPVWNLRLTTYGLRLAAELADAAARPRTLVPRGGRPRWCGSAALCFHDQFAVRASRLRLDDTAEVEEFARWAASQAMGEDLALPAVEFGYYLDHLLDDRHRMDLAVEHVRKELPPMLAACRARADQILDLPA